MTSEAHRLARGTTNERQRERKHSSPGAGTEPELPAAQHLRYTQGGETCGQRKGGISTGHRRVRTYGRQHFRPSRRDQARVHGQAPCSAKEDVSQRDF